MKNLSRRFRTRSRLVAWAMLSWIMSAQPALAQDGDRLADSQLNVANPIEAIDQVWSGHRVNPQLIQRGDHQIIVYFDASRQMSIAHRVNQTTTWRYHKLPSFVGWDSHNYVTVDVDEAGYIHVMGNMHADPLVYFRSRKPWDVRTLEQVDYLVDAQRETRVTYPRFLHDHEGRLISIFRIGGSGDGKYYYYRYDTASQTWSLLHDQQFFDGEGERGAYYTGPDVGPDGLFHTVWVWRETPSAATNNNLSYARSADLVNWEDSNGNPVSLPIIRATGEIVDPVPTFGGILNGQKRLGFDPSGQPMISYYKHDDAGDTQIMLARKAGTGWSIHQISDWTGTNQSLDRGGSLNVSILVRDPPYVASDGTIRVRVIKDGKFIEFAIDASSNKVLKVGTYSSNPAEVAAVRDNPQLTQYIVRAEGVPHDSASDFYLSWEANPPNQDQARRNIPPPSTLRLFKVAR